MTRRTVNRFFASTGIILGTITMYTFGYATGLNQVVNLSTTPGYTDGQANTPMRTAINQARAKEGKPALTEDTSLNKTAQIRAEEIAKAGKGAWNHTRPNGQSWITTVYATTTHRVAGENVAWCSATNVQTVDAWLASPTHHQNMMGQLNQTRDWTVVGVGSAWDSTNQCMIFVTHFGGQR